VLQLHFVVNPLERGGFRRFFVIVLAFRHDP
jgi:hypothetical protein